VIKRMVECLFRAAECRKWRSGRVDPFLPVVPSEQTRQVIAQFETIVMFGFPGQDPTFPGRACRTFFSPTAVPAFQHHMISRPPMRLFRARVDSVWAAAAA
jgi:hypothetical protein